MNEIDNRLDYLKAAFVQGPNGNAEKMSKAAFVRFATGNGLHYLGSIGQKTLPEIMALVDLQLSNGFPAREQRDATPDRITGTASKLTRHKADGKQSHLDLSGTHHTVWKYRGFYLVHAATLADSRCSFDSFLTVVYC